MGRGLIAVLLTMEGIINPSAIPDVTQHLREAMRATGCHEDQIRVAIRWMGGTRPTTIELSCERLEPRWEPRDVP